MYLKNIELSNFKMFEKLKLDFEKDYTILVGVNGVGKSTVLEAVSVALGAYISGIQGVQGRNFVNSEIRRETVELGSRKENTYQLPISVKGVAHLIDEGKDICWERRQNTLKGRTLVKPSRNLINYGKKVDQELMRGNKDIILPVIAFYGTDRIYNRNMVYEKDFHSRKEAYNNCLTSMTNSMTMISWFREMTYIELQEGKQIPELEAVKKAVVKCFEGEKPGCRDINLQYAVKESALILEYIDDDDTPKKIPVDMLSDGLRVTLMMVADIAYKMAVLNPQLFSDVLEKTPGIVMIDEIDMHLHPSWQRRIVTDLCSIFPEVQFIMTTHAPGILANVTHSHIRLLKNDSVYEAEISTYGKSTDEILKQIMGVDVTPGNVIKLKKEFYKLIDSEEYEKAKETLEKLEKLIGRDNASYVEAQTTLELEML